MKNISATIPWFVVAVAGILVLAKAIPPRDSEGEMRLQDFAKLPVYDGGRAKPFDSVARTDLLILNRKQSFVDTSGKPQPPIKWLLDVMTGDRLMLQVVKYQKLFHIDNPELLSFLGLQARPDGLFAVVDFGGKIKELLAAGKQALEVPADKRDGFQKATLALTQQFQGLIEKIHSEQPVAVKYKVFRIVNDQVLELLGLKPRPDPSEPAGTFRYAIDEFGDKFEKLDEEAKRARKREANQQDAFDRELLDLYHHLQTYVMLSQGAAPLAIPPLKAGQEEWQTLPEALERADEAGQSNALATAYGNLLLAYKMGDTDRFNRELDTYQAEMTRQQPYDVNRAAFEAFFNHFEPFYVCMILYVGVFILSCLSWIQWPVALNRSAFALALLALVIHTAALIGRMYIQDRWFVFVTNLYSTAVFIGWICLITGLILERIFRNGIGNIVAAFAGAFTAFIAHHLAEEKGDTMEQLVAVLDTNFWLATHVTIVNMGYAATAMAGLIGCIFIFRGLATTTLEQKDVKTLGQMMYGVLCFATLFSFTGTVLGGIWADQSWGRFWGWDPKENGAVLIVIWNALILHARWAGLVKQRGMAVLSVFGIMVTAWSWFGTNQLSVGLHAYGFSKELAEGLVVAWAILLGIIGVGLVPLKYWRSFAPNAQMREQTERRHEECEEIHGQPEGAAAYSAFVGRFSQK